MSQSRVVHWLICFALLFGVFSGLTADHVVIAAGEEEPPPEEKLELRSRYPVLPGRAGDIFDFEVEVRWQGGEFRVFDLVTTAPSEWRADVLGGFPVRVIPAIGLEPGERVPDRIRVVLVPLPWEQHDPGEYVVTLEVSSGDIRETIELKAVVTDLYRFYFTTADGRLNTEAIAGKDNHLSLMLGNTGTAVIENIDLLSEKPTGWRITFNPEEVESLEPGFAQEVEAIIKPPPGTVAGDYMITMKAISAEFRPRDLELRVTVLTPTIWGWVGILIVLAVIAGLGVLFRRLGRR